MKTTGLARLGRDGALRYTPSGECVANLALAFNYGKKGDDGNRPSQWIDASIWGKRAEVLTPYLLKGNQVVAYLSDVHIETYEGKNGTASKLVGRVDDIELVSNGQHNQPAQAAPQRQQGSQPQRQAPQQPAPRAPMQAAGGGFDNFADDLIPF